MDSQELAHLVANLPQAGTLDLYRLEYVICALRSEPRRILEIRTRVHLGMTVRFFDVHDGSYAEGRIVALRERDLTLDDVKRKLRHSGVPYAALDLQPAQGPDVEIIDPAPPSTSGKAKSLTRADFQIGDTVSFTDRSLQTLIGRITRLNPKTATVQADTGGWRVSYGLLQHVVDV